MVGAIKLQHPSPTTMSGTSVKVKGTRVTEEYGTECRFWYRINKNLIAWSQLAHNEWVMSDGWLAPKCNELRVRPGTMRAGGTLPMGQPAWSLLAEKPRSILGTNTKDCEMVDGTNEFKINLMLVHWKLWQ